MSDNPELMQNMMNAPYTRSMMEAMSADPNMAANVGFINQVLDLQYSNFYFLLDHWSKSNFTRQPSTSRANAYYDAAVHAANAKP